MKRILFVTFGLILSLRAFALPAGNPAEPQIIEEGLFMDHENAFAFKAGFQSDIVFDRKLRAHHGVTGKIDEFKAHADQGVFMVNFVDRIEASGSIGSMKAYLTNRPHIDGKKREYQTSDHLIWGLGIKGILFKWCDIVTGLNIAYQKAHPHVKWNTLSGEAFTTDAALTYEEWQASLGVSYTIDWFIPYIALKYSHVDAKLYKIRSNILAHSHFQLKNRQHVGLALGSSFSGGRLFDFSIELSFFDEQAIFLSGNLKF